MTSFIAGSGSGRSTSVIPAVPAASSVTTIAFIRHLPVSSPRGCTMRPAGLRERRQRGEAGINTLPHGFVQSIAVTRQLLAGPGLSGGGQLVDTGLWAITSSPRRNSSPDPLANDDVAMGE